MQPRVALVHDYLLVMRGAERTFAAMADCWPQAPVFTTLYDESGTEGRFAGRRVVTSGLQRLGVGQDHFRALLPLFPRAVGRLDVSGHDLVVSSSSAFAHGVRVPEGARHVCYCHSPFRYVWHERERALTEVPGLARPVLSRVLDRTRRWDVDRAREVTAYVANARITQQRIADFYGREAPVVHPPVETDRFAPGEAEDWFLLVGEVVRHKRVEVVLEALRKAGRRAKVVGSGPELERLRTAYPEAEFLGRADDAQLARLYARARALLVPSIEEFGITAVEAQAAGRPVVAPSAGGASETVLDGVTGVLLDDPSPDAYAEVLRETDFDRLRPRAAVESAARFSVPAFRDRLRAVVTASGG